MSYSVYFHLAGQACLGAGNVRIGEVFFGGLLAVRSREVFLRTPAYPRVQESRNTHKKPTPAITVLFRVQH